MIELDERVRVPEHPANLFASNELSRSLQHQFQHAEWLRLQANPPTVLEEPPGGQIHFETIKGNIAGLCLGSFHGNSLRGITGKVTSSDVTVN
jgi:hypothetical protein